MAEAVINCYEESIVTEERGELEKDRNRPEWFGFAKHRGLLAVLSAAALVGSLLVAALIGQGTPSISAFTTAGFLIWVFPPIAVLFIALCWTKNRILSLVPAVLAPLLLFLLLLIPANVLGLYWAGRSMDKSFAMSKTIIAQLEAFHKINGEYPQSIDELARSGVEVRLPPLAMSDFYTVESDGSRYSLKLLYAPGFTGGFWTFYSDWGKWEAHDPAP